MVSRLHGIQFTCPTADYPDISLEFLMGRTLDNAMLNLGLKDTATGIYLSLLMCYVPFICSCRETELID